MPFCAISILGLLLALVALNTTALAQKMTTKTTVGGDSTTIPETGFSKIVHFKTAILP